MRAPDEPFADPSTSKEQIFRATYLALGEYGYADLSIQHIADRTSLSKSTIYHHFDGKEDLLMAFADRLLEWYIEELLFEQEGDAVEIIEDSLDLVLLGETENGLTIEEFWPSRLDCIYMELRTQAIRNAEMREYFDSTDRMMREGLAALIEAGIEEGSFRDVDSNEVAALLYAVTEGALVLRSSEANPEWLALARGAIGEYLDGIKRDES